MSFIRKHSLLVLIVLCGMQLESVVYAQESDDELSTIVVLGGLVDDQGAWDIMAIADWETSPQTTFFLGAGLTETVTAQADLSTKWIEFGVDHAFSNIGVTANAGYWGEQDRLTTVDLAGSLYYETEKTRVALLGAVRDIELTLVNLTGQEVVLDADSTAIGGSFRFQPADNLFIYAAGTSYDYDSINRTDLILLCILRPDICSANISPLILARSMLNYSVSAGFDYQFKKVAINFGFSNAESFLDEQEFDVFSGGLVIPVGPVTDMELIAGVSMSENSDDIWFGGINFYIYK